LIHISNRLMDTGRSSVIPGMRVTGTIITQLSHISPYSCVKTCTDGHCRYECCQLVYTLSKYPFHSFDLYAEAIPTRLNPEPICRHAWLAAGACLLPAFVTAAEQRRVADPLMTGLINRCGLELEKKTAESHARRRADCGRTRSSHPDAAGAR
jgi:hypothetical protein